MRNGVTTEWFTEGSGQIGHLMGMSKRWASQDRKVSVLSLTLDFTRSCSILGARLSRLLPREISIGKDDTSRSEKVRHPQYEPTTG
jgi:hypothetical protein